MSLIRACWAASMLRCALSSGLGGRRILRPLFAWIVRFWTASRYAVIKDGTVVNPVPFLLPGKSGDFWTVARQILLPAVTYCAWVSRGFPGATACVESPEPQPDTASAKTTNEIAQLRATNPILGWVGPWR